MCSCSTFVRIITSGFGGVNIYQKYLIYSSALCETKNARLCVGRFKWIRKHGRDLIDPTQPQHVLTTKLYRTLRLQGRRAITTNYILAELVALLTTPLRVPRPAIIEFVDGLTASSFVEIVHIDPTLDEQAWRLLKSRPDKEWSLVDCASFVVMQQRGLTEALTTDHHFEQAGFVRLCARASTEKESSRARCGFSPGLSHDEAVNKALRLVVQISHIPQTAATP
jgi:uncharacterized protein